MWSIVIPQWRYVQVSDFFSLISWRKFPTLRYNSVVSCPGERRPCQPGPPSSLSSETPGMSWRFYRCSEWWRDEHFVPQLIKPSHLNRVSFFEKCHLKYMCQAELWCSLQNRQRKWLFYWRDPFQLEEQGNCLHGVLVCELCSLRDSHLHAVSVPWVVVTRKGLANGTPEIWGEQTVWLCSWGNPQEASCSGAFSCVKGFMVWVSHK
jgi:hypothetical protein